MRRLNRLVPYLLWATGLLSFGANAYFLFDSNPAASCALIAGIPFLAVTMWRRIRQLKSADQKAKERLPFSLLVQNSGDLIAISGKDRMIAFVNKAGRDMVGLTQQADVSRIERMDFYPEDRHEQMINEVLPAILRDGHWSGEFAYRNHATNASIPVFANLFQLKDPVTNEHLGLAVVARDIRDRKNLEKQLDRFFDVSLDMLAIANTTGFFLKLNPAFSEILGYTEDELKSRPCTDFIHPDDIAATIAQLEAQKDGRPVLSFENRYKVKTGGYRWFSWKSYPDGNLTYGAARDVTEEKLRQIEMKNLSETAVAASRAKSEFLANMSHEIRTPINGVVGMTSLLLDTPLDEQQLDYAQNIKMSSETLLTVINDILDFSKVEAGKLDFEDLDFNLETLVDETAKSLSWIVRNKSLPFVVESDRDFKHLFVGDPGRIRQILNNLLSNAVKFTPEGAIRLEVKAINKTSDATTFRFAVQDTGIGLSDSEQKKLFQAFSQADASTARKFGGTGLGLSISKKLVELMGGEIGVESALGEGSTFWFTLTLKHSSSAVDAARTKAQAFKSKHPSAQILVAEDNFVNQKILLAMLDKMGFKVQTAGNGKEVLSALKDRSFDLILMDCQMPELDGYETTKRIRASGATHAQIPIIALTANALKGDREICLAAGMDDYASKPVSAGELAQVIERWLDAASLKKRSA